jgi:TPR repeat protein
VGVEALRKAFSSEKRSSLEALFDQGVLDETDLKHPNIRKVHEVGAWRGQSFIAMQYNKAPRPRELPSLVHLAGKNNLAAQVRLGCMSANGQDIPKDEAESAKWHCKVAEQGN